MKKTVLVGLLFLSVATNSLAAPMLQNDCTDASRSVANLIGTVLYNRCTGKSADEIRNALDKAIASQPVALQLRSDDYVKILNAGAGSPNLSICVESAKKVSSQVEILEGSSKDKAEAAADVKDYDKRLANFRANRKKQEDKFKHADIKDDNARNILEATASAIGDKFEADMESGRALAIKRLEQLERNWTVTPAMAEKLHKSIIGSDIYSLGYVNICKHEPIDTADADYIYYNSAFVSKMVEMAIGTIKSDRELFLEDREWQRNHPSKQ
ncbi:MAG: hypothetical protein M0Z78_08955 [Betaproteobacteria bacterium]|nr:hypothetical protein [Betaproteobacteria bacterium]